MFKLVYRVGLVVFVFCSWWLIIDVVVGLLVLLYDFWFIWFVIWFYISFVGKFWYFLYCLLYGCYGISWGWICLGMMVIFYLWLFKLFLIFGMMVFLCVFVGVFGGLILRFFIFCYKVVIFNWVCLGMKIFDFVWLIW